MAGLYCRCSTKEPYKRRAAKYSYKLMATKEPSITGLYCRRCTKEPYKIHDRALLQSLYKRALQT